MLKTSFVTSGRSANRVTMSAMTLNYEVRNDRNYHHTETETKFQFHHLPSEMTRNYH